MMDNSILMLQFFVIAFLVYWIFYVKSIIRAPTLKPKPAIITRSSIEKIQQLLFSLGYELTLEGLDCVEIMFIDGNTTYDIVSVISTQSMLQDFNENIDDFEHNINVKQHAIILFNRFNKFNRSEVIIESMRILMIHIIKDPGHLNAFKPDVLTLLRKNVNSTVKETIKLDQMATLTPGCIDVYYNPQKQHSRV